MTLDLSKPLQLRDGTPCRLIAKDLKGEWPLAVALYLNDGSEIILQRYADGRHVATIVGESDVINVPEAPKRFRFERWVNVYSSTLGDSHGETYSRHFLSRGDADLCAQKGRTACVSVIIEGNYGDGLSGDGGES